jgi:phage host-nuclease inhibitor protein Gam
MATKKKNKTTTIMDREQLEGAMTQRTLHWVKRQKLAAVMNLKLAEIRENYEAMFAELDAGIEALDADMQAWAALHQDEFAARKSIELLNGTIGFRTCPPAVKTLRGVRAEDCVRLIEDAGDDYGILRVRTDLDRETILAKAGEIGPETLETYGLRIEQSEKFYIESKEDGPNE